MEPGNNLANLEALINILANAGEIIGFAAGGPLLFMTWLPVVCGLRGYWWKFLACSVSLIVVGLASPGIVNFLLSSHSPAGCILALAVGAILLLLQITQGLLGMFAPIAIAFREKLEQKGLIIGLTLGSFLLPLCWIAAVVVCGRNLNRKPQPFPVSES